MLSRSGLLVLALLAAPGAVHSVVNAQGSPDSSHPPRTADELVEQFRAAHGAHSVVNIARLIYWGGLGDYLQRATERQIVHDFPLTIARVTIQLLSADEMPEYDKGVRTYHPPIPTTRRMTVEFLPGSAASGGVASRSYLVGVKKGIFYLVSTVPVRG